MSIRLRPFLLLLCALLWLAACRQPDAAPTRTGRLGGASTRPATAAVSPTPSPTATAVPSQPYRDEAAGFSLLLPGNWTVSSPHPTALGRQVLLGPKPLGPGPGSSVILVADAAELTTVAAAEQLQCGGGCADELDWTETTVDGRPARQVVIGAGGPSPLEWTFVEWNGRLVYFTLHDPASLAPRDDLLATFRFQPATPTPMTTAVPTETAAPQPTPTPSATPTAIPPTATPSPEPTQSLSPLAVTLDFLQAFYDDDGTAVTFLSQERRAEALIGGRSLLEIMGLERPFRSFSVAWDDIDDLGRATIDVTLTFADGSQQIRRAVLIFEEGAWRIDGFS